MDKKRKTWNLKQSQTKVQQARERRTMWKFTTTKETLRSRLGQVFTSFGDEALPDDRALSEEMSQVPLVMAI